jgi:hypothetical protein
MKGFGVFVAAAVVLYLLFGKKKRQVLDPSNDKNLSDEFDRLNPGIAGTGDAAGAELGILPLVGAVADAEGRDAATILTGVDFTHA